MKPELKFLDGDDDGPARLIGIPCFRAGKYPQGNFTDEHCKEMCATYDVNWLQAPLTPDHLQAGAAWGWFDRFYTVPSEHGGLEVFGDCSLLWVGEWMWKSGMFKRRSIEFYSNMELPNGKKGFYIKAVSLLGAMTPAVKGLKDMFSAIPEDAKVFGQLAKYNFGEEPEGVTTLSVDDPVELETTNIFAGFSGPAGVAGLMPQPVVAFTPEYFGMGKKPKKGTEDMKTEAELKAEAEAKKAAEAANNTAPAKSFMDDPEVKAKFAELESKVEASDNRAKEAEAREAETKAKAFRSEEENRFNKVVTDNRDKISPDTESKWRLLFHAQPADTADGVAIKFKEGDTEKEISPRSLVLELMSSGAKVIDLNPEPKTKGGNPAPANFGEVPTPGTKEWSDYLHEKAKAFLEKEPNRFATYTEAAIHAESEARKKLRSA